MLFKNISCNFNKYCFSNIPDLNKEKYSEKELSEEIDKDSKKIYSILLDMQDNISSFEYIETVETDLSGKPYCISASLDEPAFYRTPSEINSIIFHKPEFRNRLKKLGFVQPQDKSSYDYALFLQVCYFMYFMIYMIFPKIKFWDLFDENNRSSESFLDGDVSNSKYLKFIYDNLYQNEQIKTIQQKRMNDYDESCGLFMDAFFCYCNHHFNNNPQADNQTNLDLLMDDLHRLNNFIRERIQITNQGNHDFISEFINYQSNIETASVINDFEENYNIIEEIQDSFLKETEKYVIPDSFWQEDIFFGELEETINGEAFILSVMNADHMTDTLLKKYQSLDFIKVVTQLWQYEKDQIENDAGQGFEFLQWDDEYFINKGELACICIAFKCLPNSISYSTKRIYLKNRDDGQKGRKRSIKRSYDSVEVDGLDYSSSALRNAVFRILCIMVMKQKQNRLDDFICFEYPLNKAVLDFQRLAEQAGDGSLEQKTAAYQMMREIFIGLCEE